MYTGHGTPGYVTPGMVHPGTVGRYTTRIYTTLSHPGYTMVHTSHSRTVSAVQGVVQCGAEEALGSRGENPMGGPHFLAKSVKSVNSGMQSCAELLPLSRING